MSSTTMDLCTVKQNFSELMNVINPWTLSHFVMWLDIKVAEYKVYGQMVLDNNPVTTPQWLKSKDIIPEVQGATSPRGRNYPTTSQTVSPTHTQHPYRPQDTVRHTAVSPQFTGVHNAPVSSSQAQVSGEQIRGSQDQSRNFTQQSVSHRRVKSTALSDSRLLTSEHSRQNTWSSHYAEQSLPSRTTEGSHGFVNRDPNDKCVVLSDGISNEYQGTRSSPTVYKNSGQSADRLSSSTGEHSSRRTGHLPLSPTIYRSGGQSTDRLGSVTEEHLSRPTGQLQSTVTQKPKQSVDSVNQNVAPSVGHVSTSQTVRPSEVSKVNDDNTSNVVVKIEISDDSNEGVANSETSNQTLPTFGQTFAGASRLARDDNAFSNQSFAEGSKMSAAASNQGHMMTFGDLSSELSIPVPVSLFQVSGSQDNELSDITHDDSQQSMTDPGQELDESWKDKKREYIERVRNTNPVNPKAHAHMVQRTKPFPDPFPVESLKYGRKAQDMIKTGIITRPAKMQFLDTVFSEIVKYTGLYPTPTQKMEVAKAIVQSFPKLNVRSKDSHISPADSWFVVLNDKFRNERRGLNQNPRNMRHIHIRQRALQTIRRAQTQALIYNMQHPNVNQEISADYKTPT